MYFLLFFLVIFRCRLSDAVTTTKINYLPNGQVGGYELIINNTVQPRIHPPLPRDRVSKIVKHTSNFGSAFTRVNEQVIGENSYLNVHSVLKQKQQPQPQPLQPQRMKYPVKNVLMVPSVRYVNGVPENVKLRFAQIGPYAALIVPDNKSEGSASDFSVPPEIRDSIKAYIEVRKPLAESSQKTETGYVYAPPTYEYASSTESASRVSSPGVNLQSGKTGNYIYPGAISTNQPGTPDMRNDNSNGIVIRVVNPTKVDPYHQTSGEKYQEFFVPVKSDQLELDKSDDIANPLRYSPGSSTSQFREVYSKGNPSTASDPSSEYRGKTDYESSLEQLPESKADVKNPIKDTLDGNIGISNIKQNSDSLKDDKGTDSDNGNFQSSWSLVETQDPDRGYNSFGGPPSGQPEFSDVSPDSDLKNMKSQQSGLETNDQFPNLEDSSGSDSSQISTAKLTFNRKPIVVSEAEQSSDASVNPLPETFDIGDISNFKSDETSSTQHIFDQESEIRYTENRGGTFKTTGTNQQSHGPAAGGDEGIPNKGSTVADSIDEFHQRQEALQSVKDTTADTAEDLAQTSGRIPETSFRQSPDTNSASVSSDLELKQDSLKGSLLENVGQISREGSVEAANQLGRFQATRPSFGQFPESEIKYTENRGETFKTAGTNQQSHGLAAGGDERNPNKGSTVADSIDEFHQRQEVLQSLKDTTADTAEDLAQTSGRIPETSFNRQPPNTNSASVSSDLELKQDSLKGSLLENVGQISREGSVEAANQLGRFQATRPSFGQFPESEIRYTENRGETFKTAGTNQQSHGPAAGGDERIPNKGSTVADSIDEFHQRQEVLQSLEDTTADTAEDSAQKSGRIPETSFRQSPNTNSASVSSDLELKQEPSKDSLLENVGQISREGSVEAANQLGRFQATRPSFGQFPESEIKYTENRGETFKTAGTNQQSHGTAAGGYERIPNKGSTIAHSIDEFHQRQEVLQSLKDTTADTAEDLAQTSGRIPETSFRQSPDTNSASVSSNLGLKQESSKGSLLENLGRISKEGSVTVEAANQLGRFQATRPSFGQFPNGGSGSANQFQSTNLKSEESSSARSAVLGEVVTTAQNSKNVPATVAASSPDQFNQFKDTLAGKFGQYDRSRVDSNLHNFGAFHQDSTRQHLEQLTNVGFLPTVPNSNQRFMQYQGQNVAQNFGLFSQDSSAAAAHHLTQDQGITRPDLGYISQEKASSVAADSKKQLNQFQSQRDQFLNTGHRNIALSTVDGTGNIPLLENERFKTFIQDPSLTSQLRFLTPNGQTAAVLISTGDSAKVELPSTASVIGQYNGNIVIPKTAVPLHISGGGTSNEYKDRHYKSFDSSENANFVSTGSQLQSNVFDSTTNNFKHVSNFEFNSAAAAAAAVAAVAADNEHFNKFDSHDVKVIVPEGSGGRNQHEEILIPKYPIPQPIEAIGVQVGYPATHLQNNHVFGTASEKFNQFDFDKSAAREEHLNQFDSTTLHNKEQAATFNSVHLHPGTSAESGGGKKPIFHYIPVGTEATATANDRAVVNQQFLANPNRASFAFIDDTGNTILKEHKESNATSENLNFRAQGIAENSRINFAVKPGGRPNADSSSTPNSHVTPTAVNVHIPEVYGGSWQQRDITLPKYVIPEANKAKIPITLQNGGSVTLHDRYAPVYGTYVTPVIKHYNEYAGVRAVATHPALVVGPHTEGILETLNGLVTVPRRHIPVET